jgi:hypothetical protein
VDGNMGGIVGQDATVVVDILVQNKLVKVTWSG